MSYLMTGYHKYLPNGHLRTEIDLVEFHEFGILPELEVRVDHPVGETFTANTDAFKHTVTGQLVHHKVRVDETCETNVHIPVKTKLSFLVTILKVINMTVNLMTMQ